MAQILIRNLDADTVARLRSRAEKAGLSLEAEVREILEYEAGREERLRPRRSGSEEAFAFADAMKERLRGRTHRDSALLRHER